MSDSINQSNRSWITLYYNKSILSHPPTVQIIIKTRADKPSEYVPNRLYSSLKYEIFQNVHISKDISSILMGTMQVVDLNNEEVLKDKKPILSGQISGVLTREEGSSYVSSKSKIQFNNVSYHFDSKYFCFKCSYYTPTNMNEPLIVIKSAPFRVYARRPTSPGKRIRKKKNLLQLYLQRLDEIMNMKDSFQENEKKRAVELVFTKLLSVDLNIIRPKNLGKIKEIHEITNINIFSIQYTKGNVISYPFLLSKICTINNSFIKKKNFFIELIFLPFELLDGNLIPNFV